MEITEWTWKTSDGLNLYACQWAPAVAPKAAVVLVHGLGEHIGRYVHVAAALTGAGYALLGFDLRGHGKSAGPRGHTPTYDALLDDISAFLGQVENRYPGVARFLYGHSLGANLVLNYPLRRSSTLCGFIATGPWLELAFQPPASRVRLARLANRIYPAFSQSNGLKASDLSHDPVVVAAYQNDPLVHEMISARMFLSLYDSGLWALAHAAEFPLPLLVMNGSQDALVSAPSARLFAERAGAKATFKGWEGMYHEIHNESVQAEVFEYMIDWLGKH